MDASREPLIRRFFAVMNEHDAASVEEVFTDDAEMVIGPHSIRGLDGIREIVLQETPGAEIVSELGELDDGGEGDIVATFVRRQTWVGSDDPPVEEDLWAVFTFAGDRIRRAALHQSYPG